VARRGRLGVLIGGWSCDRVGLGRVGLGRGRGRGRTLLPPAQLLRQSCTILVLVKVRGDGEGLALAERVEFFARLLAGRGVAGGDVDFGAVGDESFGDHAADAFGAAGDEDDFVLWRSVGWGLCCGMRDDWVGLTFTSKRFVTSMVGWGYCNWWSSRAQEGLWSLGGVCRDLPRFFVTT